jgi:predicted ATP-dependent endonuclease of OLD family
VHLRRYFYQILKQLSAMGHQIIYTTHSTEMVDLSEPHEIVRLHRILGGKTVINQVQKSSLFDFEYMHTKIRRLGNEELLFSSHVILTEGQDDQVIIYELFHKKGINPDAHRISIIACDSRSQIPDYIGLCHELGIDFYVIHDEDDPNQSEQVKENEKISNAIGACKPAKNSLYKYSPDLESISHTTKQGSDNLRHLLSLLNGKSFDQIKAEHPDLVKPVDDFLSSRKIGANTCKVKGH